MSETTKQILNRLLRERILFIDGSMGVSINNEGPEDRDYGDYPGCHEYLNISRPDLIGRVHSAFLESGCDIIETNTFGGSGITLAEFNLQDRTEEINRRAAEIAKRDAAGFSTPEHPRFVAGSIGPGTKLPSLGHIGFDPLEEGYFRQCLGLIRGRCDLLQIETCQDLLQAKAALYAARRAMKQTGIELPVTLLITVEKGKMLVGTDVATAVAAFAPFDLLAFGINCSTGPAEMYESLRSLAKTCPFPLAVMPNAGLPRWKPDGEGYTYDLTPEEFAGILSVYVEEFDIRLVGGCCGTTSQHLKLLIEQTKIRPLSRILPEPIISATSLFAEQPLRVEPRPLILGERTNATGSKKFREALSSENLDEMVGIAVEQQEEGAHILDLSLALAGRNESDDYKRLVPILNRELMIPIAFDTTDPAALEQSLKAYGGRAVINSINLEDGGKKAIKFLELAKEFGASLVCLCIDEKGMAQTAERKVEAAQKILDLAGDYGLTAGRLLFDPLTFSLATGDAALADSAKETLLGIEAIREKIPGAGTILGISNVSYGLHASVRPILNSVFLHHALQRGLDAAILHAGKIRPIDRLTPEELEACENLIFNRRDGGEDPLGRFLELFNRSRETDSHKEETEPYLPPDLRLFRMVLDGKKREIPETIEEALQHYSPLEIINDHLLKAMKEVGERFGAGRMQLPFVLKSAEVMRAAVDFLAPRLQGETPAAKGSMVLATVRGDIHDIGKNLVDIILSNNGFHIENIGKDIPSHQIIRAIRDTHPQYLGLSGLLVKSTLEMKEVLSDMNREGIDVPVICGGAALRRDFVDSVLQPEYKGKVYYARDAFDAISIMSGEPLPIPEPAQAVSRKHSPQPEEISECAPLTPPFWGRKVIRITWDDLRPFLDKKILFKSRWKIDDESQGEEWLKKTEEKLLQQSGEKFSAVYGYFPCFRRGTDLIVQFNEEEILFSFPETDPSSPSIYFRGDRDLLPLFAVTMGNGLSPLEEQLFEKKEFQEYHLFHGLGIQAAESFAALVHDHIRKELGLAPKEGRRISPGYPSWPNLEDQRKISELMKFQEIGLSLTKNDQLVPEQSVTGMVIRHPQFRY